MVIDDFSGNNVFLSNFHPSPILVFFTDPIMGKFKFPKIAATVEHAYQAMKADNIDDFLAVLAETSPGRAKRRGRQIAMRADWEDIKLGVMKDMLHQKFRHPALKKKLLDTGDMVLIEGNTWGDTFWGECPLGVGENHLGKLLMEVRKELKK